MGKGGRAVLPSPHCPILPQRQSGRAAAVDAGTGEYAGTAVGAFQWRGRAGIRGSGRASRRGGRQVLLCRYNGQRAPQTRGHGQAGHQREQDGLRTTQRHQSRSPVTSSTASTVITGRNGTAKKRRCSRTVWIVWRRADGGGQKAKGQAAGQGKLVEQRKAEQGHKRQPDKRDHGPGPKSVFERLWGRLPRMACTSSDKNPKGQNHEQKMRPRHRATASTTSAPAIKHVVYVS